MPKLRNSLSICSIVAPCSRHARASFIYGSSMRLTTKPLQSPTTIGVLPVLREIATTFCTASSDVSGPFITSTNGILLTGLKKCIPTKRDLSCI